MGKLTGSFIAAVLSAGLAGCGVGADSDPRTIPAEEVPFDLLTPSSSTTVATPRETIVAQVFFLRGERLEAVTRPVAAPSTAGTVLAALVQGPTVEEVDRGLTSAIDQETRVLSAEVVGGSAVINVSEAFSRIGVQNQISALAQLVFTATAFPDVDRVQVMIDGASVRVPRADGTSTDRPLSRSDYAAFSPATR